jgi:hypothetical protein
MQRQKSEIMYINDLDAELIERAPVSQKSQAFPINKYSNNTQTPYCN